MPTPEELFEAYALPSRVETRVRMNFVQSADGAATLAGRSGPLGGETDRTLMQVLRTMADVIVVGAGTVRAEGYGGLTVSPEHSDWRTQHGLPAQPGLAVVSRRLELGPEDAFFTEAVGRPVVVTSATAPKVGRQALEAVADVIECGEESVDLHSMLTQFAVRRWTQVLCEGGPHLFGDLLDAGLVDEVCITLAPRFVGGAGGRIARGAPESDRRFTLVHALTDDEGFVLLRYVG